jgi:hypothetical protein
MKYLIGTAVFLLLFISSSNIFGQEEKQPNWLVVSQNMVPMAKVSVVNKMIDSIAVPILNELVDEGMLTGWGQFNHAWGDEWNVNFWYVTKDQNSFSAFWAEYVRRVSERHPGSFASIVKHFQAHKDNMYVIRNQYQAMSEAGVSESRE